MPRYHVHFTADPDDPVLPLAELPSTEADDPAKAVEAMLAAGRYPQDPSIPLGAGGGRASSRWQPAVSLAVPGSRGADGRGD